MAAWLRVLEAYLVQALLRTPAFHRGVEKVVKGVNRVRHGIPPEEMGGTKIDQPGNAGFLRHFQEEIQTQLGRAEARSGETAVKSEGQAASKGQWEPAEESAETVWRTARKNVEDGQKQSQGFMGEYMAALREQAKGGK